MNIQIYVSKSNPDVLKAERFFKERKIKVQLVDVKKHRPGLRELELFARAAGGARHLVERRGMKALERPVAHMSDESLILSELQNDSTALVSPIVRNGLLVTMGVNEQVWQQWIDKSVE
jgi:arsenate reductase (glutaredoxin)